MLISDIFSCFSRWFRSISNDFFPSHGHHQHHHLALIESNESIDMFPRLICWSNIFFDLSWWNYCFQQGNCRGEECECESIQSICSMSFSVRNLFLFQFNQRKSLVHRIIMNVNLSKIFQKMKLGRVK